ncbi:MULTISPECIES: glycoside hydrolase family 32 protein [Collinsella]|uniref:glycoside hydrolase family 32 protein n=1 Tax=Collinsella TaxID=102106 RepID=UPI0013023A44|nr:MULTISPECIES: glycoside hydrolase family 32 protein [Collinsella]MBM6907240.1 glycoside hydrolase family 32 protein [Collinsella intestinalis]
MGMTKATSPSSWRCGFHLMPPVGWLNDPNGLCQFRGVYHVFHQYSPAWPEPNAPRGWGHATSCDLVHWEHHGMVIAPDTDDETHGSYSGCAVVLPGAAADGGDALRLYYTGNVKEPGDYDYIRSGRRATQLMIETDDGFALGPKRVLMRNGDYPITCSCHVRDPKVWREGGAWWMILGARDLFDRGFVLVYRSDDGVAWAFHGQVRTRDDFGYMWECPDRIALDGREYLSFCPQGMEERPWACGLRDQAGYIPVPDGVCLVEAPALDATAFRRWDAGFDFYAPQTFTDDAGRTILIGWMGLPEPPYASAPAGMDWCHCLTVPRVLSRAAGGAITQAPAPELEALRGPERELEPGGALKLADHRADIVLAGVGEGTVLTLDGVLEVRCENGGVTLSFADAAAGEAGVGGGRARRSCAADGGRAVRDLRVLVDGSAVEVFADGGRIVFATRWFPRADELTVTLAGACERARLWAMGDGMAATWGAA